MRKLNVPKSNFKCVVVIKALIKYRSCDIRKERSQRRRKMKRDCRVKLFTHVTQTYHKKPYPNVVKKMLLREPDTTQLQINTKRLVKEGAVKNYYLTVIAKVFIGRKVLNLHPND